MDRRNAALGVALAVFLCLAAGAAGATEVLLSTTNGATLGGLAFRDGDVVQYDDQTDAASLFFDEDAFLADEQVDAFHLLPNGHVVLSIGGLGDLGGLALRDGDVVDYDPVALTATLLLDEDLFLADEDVDAFSVLPNGSFLLSTVNTATLGGLTFEDGDLVEYDPLSGIATLFLAENLVFSSDADIDAVHAVSDSVVVLSTTGTATIGGVTFADGDLVEYDVPSDTASLVFSQSSFAGGSEDIDGVYVVPEPASGLLLAGGLALLARRRGRRARRGRAG